MANWYVNSVGWTAVTAWFLLTAKSVGDIVRQAATPTEGNERVFLCTTAGTTGSTEPVWAITKSATTTDGSVVWTEITGQAAFNGDGGGTNWGAPFPRLHKALTATWAANGDTVYVSNSHNEANANAVDYTTAMAGSESIPVKIICVPNATVPPVSKTIGAIVASTATGQSITIRLNAYVYGITFKAGTGSGSAAITVGNNGSGATSLNQVYEECSYQLNTTAAGTTTRINIGTGGGTNSRASFIKLINPTFILGSTSQRVAFGNAIIEIIKGIYAATGSVPAIAFEGQTGTGAVAKLKGMDLASIVGTLFNAAITTNFLDVLLDKCKLGSGVAVVTGSNIGLANCDIRLHACDSAATSNRVFKSNAHGQGQKETTVIRTGGSDVSNAIITTSTCTPFFPFVTEDIYINNTVTGSAITVRFEIAGASGLTNNDIWAEVDYLGSSGSPIVSVITSRVSDPIFGTPTAYTSSSESWGGAPASKQFMSVTFTPQMAGALKARVYVGKASTTVYLDLLLAVS